MCAHFSIGYIDFMLKAKGLLEYKNFLLSNKKEWKNNIKIFSMIKIYCKH